MPNEKILVVDDDTNICELLRLYLEKEGYVVKIVNDGVSAINAFKQENPDLTLLDIMIPKLDGWQVCREIRKFSDKPIIMLTAKGEDMDKILGLEYGADDYMTKPFNILEVKARIKTILRRAGAGKEAPRMEITAGDITININTRSVISHGEPVNLTVKEFDLLNLFMSNIGKIYSRDELLETIWGFDYIGDFRTVDVHIRRLREKIEKDPANPKHIMTKWGVGYYFAE